MLDAALHAIAHDAAERGTDVRATAGLLVAAPSVPGQ